MSGIRYLVLPTIKCMFTSVNSAFLCGENKTVLIDKNQLTQMWCWKEQYSKPDRILLDSQNTPIINIYQPTRSKESTKRSFRTSFFTPLNFSSSVYQTGNIGYFAYLLHRTYFPSFPGSTYSCPTRWFPVLCIKVVLLVVPFTVHHFSPLKDPVSLPHGSKKGNF